MDTQLLSVKEASEILGISERAIRNRIERGEMHATRIGERVLVIPRDEVDRWRSVGKLKPGPKRQSG